MTPNFHLFLLVFSLSSTLAAAGQQNCSGCFNMTFVDDLSRIRFKKLFSQTFNDSKAETKIHRTPSSTLSVATKLDVPSAIGSIPIHMKETRLTFSDNERSEKSNNSNSTFLSFDEWRIAKLNEELADKPVRSLERSEFSESDCIGDGMEVELGFFSNVGENFSKEREEDGEGYKHKFNFASLDCAATIVKANSEASGASSVLIENKDKYLLNPCSVANKFVIIELCQDILVEEIEVANFEFFSSTFKKLRFSVSNRYPAIKNEWTVLGEFDAENSRSLQKFSIDNPQIWARYLQIEILSHHDNEYYCPISLIRVHGKTMMDDYKMDNSKANAQKTSIAQEIASDDSQKIQAEDLVDKCDLWPSIKPDNITFPHQIPDVFTNCRSKLEPLRFEEFLRELNDTYCPIVDLKEVNHNTASASSSSTASTEESIFKNIMKRLSSLEGNTTLSILYMEEQGKLLSNSFEQLEKAQIMKFDNLVSMFNDTMMDNLNVLRIFANQLKDQSIRILEEQKLNNDQFTTTIMLRVENLEKELRLQKNFLYVIVFGALFIFIYTLLSHESKLDEYIKKDTLFEASRHSFVTLPASPTSL